MCNVNLLYWTLVKNATNKNIILWHYCNKNCGKSLRNGSFFHQFLFFLKFFLAFLQLQNQQDSLMQNQIAISMSNNRSINFQGYFCLMIEKGQDTKGLHCYFRKEASCLKVPGVSCLDFNVLARLHRYAEWVLCHGLDGLRITLSQNAPELTTFLNKGSCFQGCRTSNSSKLFVHFSC